MIYIIISIIGLLVIVALFTYSSKSKTKTEEPPVVVPPADCCGTHAICEKGLKKSNISMMKNSINTGVFPPTVSMTNKSTNSGKSSTRSVLKSYPIGLSAWKSEESNYQMF